MGLALVIGHNAHADDFRQFEVGTVIVARRVVQRIAERWSMGRVRPLHRLFRACLRSESGQLCVLPPVPYERLRDWPHTIEPHIQTTHSRHADAIRAGCASCATFPLVDMTEEVAIHCLHHSAMDMCVGIEGAPYAACRL